MALSAWSRTRKAVAEALGYAEGLRAMAVRVVAWLALLGLPLTADKVVPEQYLPLTPYGVLVWTASILLAFALSTRAIYVKQKELDERTGEAKAQYLERRRKLWAAMRKVSLAHDRLRRFVDKERRKHGPDRLKAESQRQTLEDSVNSYWTVANELPTLEATLHMHIVSRLQEALESDSDINLVKSLDDPIQELLALLTRQTTTLDDPMGDAERDSIVHHVEQEHPDWLSDRHPPEES